MTATSSSVASSAIRSPMLNKNNNSFSNTRFNNSNNFSRLPPHRNNRRHKLRNLPHHHNNSKHPTA